MLYLRHLSDVQVKTLGRMLDRRSCLGFGRDSGCAAVMGVTKSWTRLSD